MYDASQVVGIRFVFKPTHHSPPPPFPRVFLYQFLLHVGWSTNTILTPDSTQNGEKSSGTSFFLNPRKLSLFFLIICALINMYIGFFSIENKLKTF
jgi:hypothetical protein